MPDSESTPAARLAELGVARISHGPGPYLLVMRALGNAPRQHLESPEPILVNHLPDIWWSLLPNVR